MPLKKSAQTRAASKGARPLGIPEMLRRKPRDIIIDKGQSVDVEPDNEFADYFIDLKVRSFDDLRALHLIAPDLDEQRTRHAIAIDNERSFELAREQLRNGAAECNCHGSALQRFSVAPFHERLRNTYGAIRKHQHIELAQVLSENARRQVAWDSLEAQLTCSWVDKLSAMSQIDLQVLQAANIIVENNATMTVAATTKYLLAHDINIHTGGKIVIKGSYIKVRCRSAHGNLP